WFTFSYTPVRDADGQVAGVVCIGTETTAQVVMQLRQAFRLTLADELRELGSPQEILVRASRRLGEYLDAARVGYVEVNDAEGQFTVRHDWTASDLAPLTGQTMDYDDFGPRTLEDLRAGLILKLEDTARDERSAAFAHSYEAIGVRSVLGVPLVKDGRLCAVLRIHHREPHRWTDEEVVLAQDTAERTWAAVERARAEEQRRAAEEALLSNAKLQAFQIELSDTLRMLSEPGDIIAASTALLGRYLDVSRVLFAQVNEAKASFDVQYGWTAPGVPGMAGRISQVHHFGAGALAQLRAGQAVAVDDVERDERTSAHLRAFASMGVRSFLALPLVRGGRLSIVLLLHRQEPCRWQQQEVQRARDMAERAWSGVEAARAQAALRAERDQSRYVFDSMTEGFAMLDPDCTLVQMNAEGRRISRVTSGDVIGRKVWEVFPKVVNSGLHELYEQVMVTGKGSSIEYKRVLDGDEISWMEVRAYPALDGGLAVFYRDINERKRGEQKLKEADRRKDEFLAMLAHELRNPLAPIAAAAELLSRSELDSYDLKHSSDVIARQVAHMTSLVNDLLDISRVTGGLVAIERVPLDMNEILPEALEQVSPLIRTRAHQLIVNHAPGPAWVWGDRTRLVQVIANLLNNAAKYTPAGGQIDVGIEVRPGHVAMSVRDDGIGMSPDLVESAFELFAQAERSPDRTEGGLGIGLALVRAIVALHGGTVTARSDGIGRGSEFLVLLPEAGDKRPPAAPSTSVSLSPANTPELKVLIVDDNVDAGRMLAMLMKLAGHRAFVEHIPQHALEMARLLQPDVCLLDIGLPGMSGNEVARRLRALPETSGALLIAVTGYSRGPNGEGAVAPEFDHHLIKPIESGRLLALLRQIGAH
ncbi:MAG TPA: GAF domain-containing protein, partial [Ramlibacter sp.]|nr:GAF domain-containing protein [Ramlibacter sp.]